MGANSRIEWTDHTFNPWWGCTKVSEACKFCYAESWARRVGQQVWGPTTGRRFFGETHWAAPLKWNSEAARTGQRARVFCASMGDVFEDRPDLNEWRSKLWPLITSTPNLDWLLLTKRPENVNRMIGPDHEWAPNVWLGTTIENQEAADHRLPHLGTIRTAVRFISAEPLLGPISIEKSLGSIVNWVIAGGESGPKARPSCPSWFRSLVDQCVTAGVPFHFKQWGDWAPGGITPSNQRTFRTSDGTLMRRLGKRAAGRILDGLTWDGVPEVRSEW